MNMPRSISRRQCPLHALETREIAIEAKDSRAVFDRQRGKMRVRRQIAGGAGGLEQSAEDRSMPLAGMRHLRLGMPEPALDDPERIFHRERPGKDAATRAQAQERQSAVHAKATPRGSSKPCRNAPSAAAC